MMIIGTGIALAACHSRPVAEQPPPTIAPPEPPIEVTPPSPPQQDATVEQPPAPNTDVNVIPPCVPEAHKPKVAVKRRTRPIQGSEKPTPVETQPPRLGSSTPEVRAIDASVGSILGKKVQGAAGEDLGRIVDVQADATGRVRLVIIEFGGFLGVGNRRAAIDWGLLRFHPDDPERPISLSVGARQLQGTPEYRQALHPQALMEPAPADAAQPATLPSQNK